MSNQNPFDSSGSALIDQILQQNLGVDQNYLNAHDRRMGAYDPKYGVSYQDWVKNKQDTNKVQDLQDQIVPSLLGKGYTLEDLGFKNIPGQGAAAFGHWADQENQAKGMNTQGLNYDPKYLSGLFGNPQGNPPTPSGGPPPGNPSTPSGGGPTNSTVPTMQTAMGNGTNYSSSNQQPNNQAASNQQQNSQSYSTTPNNQPQAQTQVQPQMAQLMGGNSLPFQQKQYQRQY